MDTQQPNQNPIAAPQPHGFLKQMEDFFDTYLHKKVPFHLPPAAKEWIVKFGPWITLVLMIFGALAMLAAIGLSAVFSPVAKMYGGYGNQITYLLGALIGLIAFVMEAVALPGLFKRSLKSWHLVYYAVLVSAVGQLIDGSFINLIFNVVISMYFLFEIREYYK
jgi:hypothetical protein